jgi:ABC-type transport system involved in cytochrome c biogenesis ATPase subunit
MKKRKDHFNIRRISRTYDRDQGKFSFNIAYETKVKLTPRTRVVAEAFGLGIDETQKFPILETELKIKPSDVVYITGDSGSGKSVLLRAIRADLGDEAIDLSEVATDPEKPIIETVGNTVEEGLELLSKVGLNDAFLFLRTYQQLSDGQKYRYRIAKLIESKKQWWLMDEFAACLDRDTAKIIAFNLQKIARQQQKSVIAATTHNDLQTDLNPDVLIVKRYGREIEIQYKQCPIPAECSLIKEMKIEQGTITDWKNLAQFHYRTHKVAAPRKIFRIMKEDELCGVIVYGYPPPICQGRKNMLPKMTMQELNQQLSIISRVVVHPKYRSIGLGAKLIQQTLTKAGTPYIEMVAVMAKYNPFSEKAGMKKVTLMQPNNNTQKTAQTLQSLGINLQLIASENYTKQKLTDLTPKEITQLKQALIKDKNPRFKKAFQSSCREPYGKAANYKTDIENANTEKLTQLIKILATLRQSKVYLFWTSQEQKQFT